jgi:hypothetical protein
MKTTLLINIIRGCLPVLAVAVTCVTALGAETNAVKRPMSVFADDPRAGRDPFYPESTRRVRVVAQTPTLSPKSTTAPAAEASLFLKGISGTKELPLAIINNTTIAEGESADVRTGIASVKIRCREIRDRSVVVEIPLTGEVRELKLRDGI